MNFMQAMDIVEEGFRIWREKEHNAKWWKRIDGTPIPNDLSVNIAEAMCRSSADRIEVLEKALRETEALGKYWQARAIKAEGIPAAIAPEQDK